MFEPEPSKSVFGHIGTVSQVALGQDKVFNLKNGNGGVPGHRFQIMVRQMS